MSDLLKCENVMCSFILLVKTNAAFSLAYCGFIRTAEAGAKLDHPHFVNMAEISIPCGVSGKHASSDYI